MEAYFRELTQMRSLGYEPRLLVQAVLVGLEAMQSNDGTLSNEERFFDAASALLGDGVRRHKPIFGSFTSMNFSE